MGISTFFCRVPWLISYPSMREWKSACYSTQQWRFYTFFCPSVFFYLSFTFSFLLPVQGKVRGLLAQLLCWKLRTRSLFLVLLLVGKWRMICGPLIIQNSELAESHVPQLWSQGHPGCHSAGWSEPPALCDDEMENRGFGSPFSCHFSLFQL